jgi:Uma2 family endonuclease
MRDDSTATATVAPETDQVVVLCGVTWEQYEALLALFGDDFPGMRMAYLEGDLEIRKLSRKHETIKKLVARLVEIYALERDIPLNGVGSTTFRKQAKERGVEPDECYVVGEDKEYPDIVFEVVLTSGGGDRLAIYEGLIVPEVWFWQHDRFALYRLTPSGYERRERSELLPELDFGALAGFVGQRDQTRAVRSFRDSLRRPEGA